MQVQLVNIAHARSGDKGDTANVGLIALKPEWYAVLERYVTRERVAAHFAGQISGDVVRFELPNLMALNFLLHGALDGGGRQPAKASSPCGAWACSASTPLASLSTFTCCPGWMPRNCSNSRFKVIWPLAVTVRVAMVCSGGWKVRKLCLTC